MNTLKTTERTSTLQEEKATIEDLMNEIEYNVHQMKLLGFHPNAIQAVKNKLYDITEELTRLNDVVSDLFR